MRKMRELYKRTPFNQPLVSSKLAESGRIRTLRNCPDKVVRLLRPISPINSFDDQLERVSIASGLWKEFGTYQGVKVPSFRVVVGEGHPSSYDGVIVPHTFFVVTEYINGHNLEQATIPVKEIPVFQEKLDNMFSAVVQYSMDKQRNGGWYLTDQKLEQYVYGSTRDNPTEQLYFVDLDWECGLYNPGDRYKNFAFYNSYLRNLLRMIEGVEQRFGVGLTKSRNQFANFLETISASHPYSKDTERLRQRVIDQEGYRFQSPLTK